ncbi:MAG: hypothetical protein E7260_06730 [Lachnospiraceae bacterium]|nr:hypothetical protein [Lachnospiraceae bacterium]
MRNGDNIRLRTDGRYEARYVKSRDASGKIQYGYCYGKTYEEAKEKRDYQLQKILMPKTLKLLILGAGSHGRDVYEIAKSLRIFSTIAFLDDNLSKDGVIGKWNELEQFHEEYPVAIVAVGDEGTRRYWTEKLIANGFIIPTLIHPTAFVPEDTEIGIGTVICARSTISSGVTIGRGCIVVTGSTVPRKTKIPNWGYFDLDKMIHYREEYYLSNCEENENEAD